MSEKPFRVVENTFKVQGDAKTVWKLLSDVRKLAPMLGLDKCELNLIDDKTADITIGLKLGLMNLQAEGKMEVMEKLECEKIVVQACLTGGTYKKAVEKESSESAPVVITISAGLKPLSKTETEINYRIVFDVKAGILKWIYGKIIDNKVPKIHESFVESFNAALEQEERAL
jgi:carbon monoxide dehydrogenase subunit G